MAPSDPLVRFLTATDTVSKASFRHIAPGSAQIPGEVTFEDCDFSGADFTGANLAGLTFDRCTFQQTRFCRATLSTVTFRDCSDFGGADFSACEGRRASFLGCTLTGLKAPGARLRDGDFTGSDIARADFSGADLSGCAGLVSDATNFRKAVLIPPELPGWTARGARDWFRALFGLQREPWRALRLRFTGLNLVLSTVPALIFLASLFVETLFTVAVTVSSQDDPVGFVRTCQQAQTCIAAPLWKIALGLNDSWQAVAFVVFALGHNALRFAVTLSVNRLSGEEDINGITPARQDYARLRSLSHGLTISQYVMLALFCWNMALLATKEVPLPAPPAAQATADAPAPGR